MSRPYVIRITPADVGRRVSVRSRLVAGPGEPSSTDTVGRLVDWTDDVLTIVKRDGSRARVAVADLLAGKTIPEPPPRPPRSTLPQDR
jgi:N-acetylglutamate synthase